MSKKLFALADSEGIIIRETILPGDILGVYYSVCGKPPVILLHQNITKCRRLTRSVLSEELGHHFTCGLNLIAFARQKKTYITEKYERHALWWATKYLVPWPELVGAIEDDKFFLVTELAEHFEVTERFMWTSIDLYDEKMPRKMAIIKKKLLVG